MTRLLTEPAYRNRHGLYADRVAAGQELGERLARELKAETAGMVLVIPSGGVPVGLEVARRLSWPLELVIVRKLQVPGHTEAGFGAMTLDGQVWLNDDLVRRASITQAEIEAEQRKVAAELRRRDQAFRGGRPFPDLRGATAVLVDDGLASGYTMFAAVASVRASGAARIIVAVPTAPVRTAKTVARKVDMLLSPHVQDGYPFAVAAAYRVWRDLEPDEVRTMLDAYGNEQ